MTELEFLQTATEEDLLTRLPKKEDPYTSEEIESYRTDSIAKEEARLAEVARKKDLRDRFENLNNMRHAFHQTHPDIPNPATWITSLIKSDDHSAAEQSIKDLETKDIELKAVRDSDKNEEEAKSLSKSDAKTRLQAIDWTKVTTNADLKTVIQDIHKILTN